MVWWWHGVVVSWCRGGMVWCGGGVVRGNGVEMVMW